MIFSFWRKLKLLYLRFKLRNSFFTEREVLSGSSGFIVEFVGPPGVGKSTYCDHLVKVLKKDYFVSSGNQMKALLQTNYRPYIKYRQFHKTFFCKLLMHLSKFVVHLPQNITKTKSGLMELEVDAMSALFNGIVVNDEGLGHHFTDVFLNTGNLPRKNDFVDTYLDNRLVVFLDCSPDTVLIRVKERFRKSNHIWNGHIGQSDAEINEITSKDLISKRSFCNFIKEYNSSAIIVLDAEIPISHNIRVIDKTIRNKCGLFLRKK